MLREFTLAIALVPAFGAFAQDPARVVEQHCAGCHKAGARGAPAIGDAAAWSARAAKGSLRLTRNAIQGMGWGMPARGGVPSLTDAQIEGAVGEMVVRSGARLVALGRAAGEECSSASRGTGRSVVDGIVVRLSTISARMLREYPPGSEERALFATAAGDEVHVNVTLHEAATRTPVEGALVQVRIEQPGAVPQIIALAPLKGLTASSYGRLVRVVPGAPCAFTVSVRDESGRVAQVALGAPVR